MRPTCPKCRSEKWNLHEQNDDSVPISPVWMCEECGHEEEDEDLEEFKLWFQKEYDSDTEDELKALERYSYSEVKYTIADLRDAFLAGKTARRRREAEEARSNGNRDLVHEG